MTRRVEGASDGAATLGVAIGIVLVAQVPHARGRDSPDEGVQPPASRARPRTDMHARFQALDALRGLRTVIEGLPGLTYPARLAAIRAWRDHEEQLRALLPALGLSAGHAAETAARLLWCRLHVLTLAGAPGPIEPTPETVAAQDGALNALAVVAVAIGAAEVERDAAGDAPAPPTP